MNQNHIDTVRLLLAIAPAVFASGRFATYIKEDSRGDKVDYLLA